MFLYLRVLCFLHYSDPYPTCAPTPTPTPTLTLIPTLVPAFTLTSEIIWEIASNV